MKPHRLIQLGMVLLAAGVLIGMSMPFLKYAPGRDERGYYSTNNRNKEKIYSDTARSEYWSYYGSSYGSAALLLVGFGGVFLGAYQVFRNRKNEKSA